MLVVKKSTVSAADLLAVIRMMQESGIKFWLDGGWGVDVLAGHQSREHRDIDIDFDAAHTVKLIDILQRKGYVTEIDELPVRMELHHPLLGYIDIHPFELKADGSARQADPFGGWYEIMAEYFGSTVFAGLEIPCISALGQKVFHSGYELREVDKHDLLIIEELMAGGEEK